MSSIVRTVAVAALLLVGCAETAPPEPTDSGIVLETLDAPGGTRILIVERTTETSSIEYCIDYTHGDGGLEACRGAADFEEPLVAFFPSLDGINTVVAVDPHRRIGQLITRTERGERRTDSEGGLAAVVFSVRPIESAEVIGIDGHPLVEMPPEAPPAD